MSRIKLHVFKAIINVVITSPTKVLVAVMVVQETNIIRWMRLVSPYSDASWHGNNKKLVPHHGLSSRLHTVSFHNYVFYSNIQYRHQLWKEAATTTLSKDIAQCWGMKWFGCVFSPGHSRTLWEVLILMWKSCVSEILHWPDALCEGCFILSGGDDTKRHILACWSYSVHHV